MNQFSEQQRPDQVVDSFKWIQFSCQILALASGSHLGHNVTIFVVDVIVILYPKLEKCSQLSLTYDSSNSNNNMLACLFIAKINVYRFRLFVCITLYYWWHAWRTKKYKTVRQYDIRFPGHHHHHHHQARSKMYIWLWWFQLIFSNALCMLFCILSVDACMRWNLILTSNDKQEFKAK